LASLITRSKSETKALDVLEGRIKDLEARISEALATGKEALAQDAAKLLANLENERNLRDRTLMSSQEKAERMRLAIEKTHRQLIDLRQGLITAKSIEAERKAIGHTVLKRLLDNPDPIDAMEALEELEAGLSGESVIDRLSDAGIGTSDKVQAKDILARLKAEIPKSKKAKTA